MRCVLPWLVFPLFLFAGCGGDDRPEIRIYTSIYQHVIDEMAPVFAAEFPEAQIQWERKGSEQVAVRLNAELAASGTTCDLLVTSDPFYYLQLKEAGELLAHESEATRTVPAGLKDPDGAFCTVRIPVMVMAVRKDLDASKRPEAFRDLTDERFDGLVTMGDPLKSGTNFTTVAVLSTKYGWAFYEALRARGILAAGGNSAVLRRLETGERSVGVILLENLLSRDLGDDNPIETVFPTDGAVPVPSPIAILKHTEEPDLARRVHDFFFSKAVQDLIVAGDMYSPLPAHAPPEGAPAWSALELHPWTNELLHDVKSRRDAIKERWREVIR